MSGDVIQRIPKSSTKENVDEDIQRSSQETWERMEKMEVKLYNKYAYDYRDTREGKGGEENRSEK